MKLKSSIIKTLLIAALFFFIMSAALPAQSGMPPRLTPDQKALDYFYLGRQNNGFSWIEYAQIILWASGDTSLTTLPKIRQTVEALHSSSELPALQKEKAEFILTFLHKNTLRTYLSNQTRVDTIYSNGRYNCVSSALLYMILCHSAGIQTSGVLTKDHAFITVHIDGEDIDVETTNRNGFDPGSRKEFHDQFGRLTGFSYVPARNYRERQTISNIELVSMILSNRISYLEKQSKYADAVPLAIDRAALLLGDSLSETSEVYLSESLFTDPHKSLLDSLFNYGAWLLKAGREEDGLNWATSASLMYPDDQRWQDFIFIAVNNSFTRFIRENKLSEAKKFLEDQKDSITDAGFFQLDSILLDAQLLRNSNQIAAAEEGYSVVDAIEQALKDGRITEKRAVELLTFAVQKTAAVLCAAPKKDWRAAVEYMETSIARFGSNREFEQTLRTYRNNLAVDYHNLFADEWNEKNYKEAQRILDEALTEFPGDSRLLADREIVNKLNSP